MGLASAGAECQFVVKPTPREMAAFSSCGSDVACLGGAVHRPASYYYYY